MSCSCRMRRTCRTGRSPTTPRFSWRQSHQWSAGANASSRSPHRTNPGRNGMWIERARRAAALCVALTAIAGAGSASAARWTNHIDASMTHEIVLRDNLLYIATYGGILVFDPATQEFEQYRNDTGLPSNALRCLAFDEDGDIYV